MHSFGFNQRLHREWAIETGLIEQLYVLDRGVTQMLIDRGIDAALIPHGDGQNPASVAAMINDHQAAVESVFRFVKGERPLSTSQTAEGRLREVRDKLYEVQELLTDAAFFVDGDADHGGKSHYFGWQIVEAAKKLGYYANRETYRSWVRLVMKDAAADRTELLISFHGLGQEFQGVLACSAICFQRSETEAGERQTTAGEPVSDGMFQINYKEPVEEARRRFLVWLEPGIVRALEGWQATL